MNDRFIKILALLWAIELMAIDIVVDPIGVRIFRKVEITRIKEES